MKFKTLHGLLTVALLCAGIGSARADEEQDLIKTLQGNAGVVEKCAACQRLRVVGTDQAISALAPLLLEESTSQAARYALEPLASPQAAVALREAFGKTSGKLKAGLADSIGWRKDSAALPQLTSSLADADPVVGSAVARALGRISGKASTEALRRGREKVSVAVRLEIEESLLLCGESDLKSGDATSALATYQELMANNVPDFIRIAAWRGLVKADPRGNAERLPEALRGKDAGLWLAALKEVRQLNDVATWRACVKQWETLPEESQAALVAAGVAVGPDALPILRTAAVSQKLLVRQAAWTAAAKFSDPGLIPALAKAAARGEASERLMARETLATMQGSGLREGLLEQIADSEPAEKVELLIALGDRGDTAGETLLLKYAADGMGPVRLAALDSLGKLGLPTSVSPLLELAIKAPAQGDVEPILEALGVICRNGARREAASGVIMGRMNGLAASERARLLPLMAELGTSPALQAVVAATRDADAQVVKEAIRVLSQWPNADGASPLLEFSRTTSDSTFQVLAFRGAIDGLAQEPDSAVRLQKLRQALGLAQRPEERRQALGQISQIANAEALAILLPALEDPALANEAALGSLGIAEKIAAANPQLANDTAVKVLAHSRNPDFIKRAWALRGKPPGPFIKSWLTSGPFTQPGAATAMASFDVVFAPEKAGEAVTWKPLQSGDVADLLSVYPGQLNCTAYLKTTITSPEDLEGMLLLGSDDGVKAWLNGAVVHASNVDRGLVTDQDVAPVKLKKGANELLLKVTQGGGGWAACARVIASDGSPISGLKISAEP